MMHCIQFYLKNGIIKDPMFNSKHIRFVREAGNEMLDYLLENLENDKRYNKEQFYQEVISKIPELKIINQYTITSWVGLYCKAMGLKFDQNHSGDENYFIVTDPKK
jgi:fructose-1,6-bisphosphatase